MSRLDTVGEVTMARPSKFAWHPLFGTAHAIGCTDPTHRTAPLSPGANELLTVVLDLSPKHTVHLGDAPLQPLHLRYVRHYGHLALTPSIRLRSNCLGGMSSFHHRDTPYSVLDRSTIVSIAWFSTLGSWHTITTGTYMEKYAGLIIPCLDSVRSSVLV